MDQSFSDIIKLCGGADALAADLGVKAETVRKWRFRQSIPAEWWLEVIRAAKARGQDISTDQIAAIAARKNDVTPSVETAEATT